MGKPKQIHRQQFTIITEVVLPGLPMEPKQTSKLTNYNFDVVCYYDESKGIQNDTTIKEIFNR